MQLERARAIAAYVARATMLVRVAAQPKQWKQIHKAADSNLDAWLKTIKNIFHDAWKAVSQSKLKKALESKDEKKVEAALDPALNIMRKQLKSKLPSLITQTMKDGGDAAAKNLNASLGRMRTSAKTGLSIGMKFDVTNPEAVKWAEEHTGDLIDDLPQTTIDQLREIITSGFEEGKDVDELTKAVNDVIGYSDRAALIARTETMTAANEGQSQLWDQAIEDGLLTGKERQVWIVTDDDRLCPECEALDGAEAELGGEFPGDGGDGPPLHPNCR